MNELNNIYDDYGDLSKENYFVRCFNTIPSQLLLELPLEVSKKNMELVLQELDFTTYDINLVNQKWQTSNNKHDNTEADFPCVCFYKSQVTSLCILVALSNGELSLEFLYDHVDTELENWIISTYRKVRDKLGKKKSPTFKILSRGGSDFYTEDININHFTVDVEKLYNDDFLEIHQIIHDSLQVETSGLILLHGQPGTGKTSYIKSLLSEHGSSKFIFVPNDFVNALLQPDFISFLITNKNAILVIEDAEKVITSRDSTNQNSVVSTILQLTDGLFSDYLNIKIICTFNTSIDKIDKALLRKGRMIAFYEFKALSSQKSNKLLKSLGLEGDSTEKTLAEIFNFSKNGFEDKKDEQSIGFQQ